MILMSKNFDSTSEMCEKPGGVYDTLIKQRLLRKHFYIQLGPSLVSDNDHVVPVPTVQPSFKSINEHRCGQKACRIGEHEQKRTPTAFKCPKCDEPCYIQHGTIICRKCHTCF